MMGVNLTIPERLGHRYFPAFRCAQRAAIAFFARAFR
jgi:hypothetical protein